MTITTIEKIVSFLKPVISDDTPPVFASGNARKVTVALCSMYLDGNQCRPRFNDYASSILKRFQVIVPQPIVDNGMLQFRFLDRLYMVVCDRNICSPFPISKQNIVGKVVDQFFSNVMTFLFANYSTPSPITVASSEYFRSAGWTALMKMSEKGDVRSVKKLLAMGVDTKAQNEYGETALSIAAGTGHEKIVRLLEANDVDARGIDGRTALMNASKEGDLEAVKTLLAKGADVNAGCEMGETALLMAYMGGYTEIVVLLVANDADVEVKNVSGETLLMLAAQYGDVESVELLVAYGADVNVKDNDGESVLQHAAANGHSKIVNLLKYNGAK